MQHNHRLSIDAHHHLWRYDPVGFAWIAPDSRIACDFGPVDLDGAMASCGIGAAIAVQARQTTAETRFLLAAAMDAPIVGVVGWVDLRADTIEPLLEADAADDPRGLIVGYRHVVQDEADERFLLTPAFVRGVRAVVARGLSYDLLVNPRQLGDVPAFLDRVCDGRFVLDHGAKPLIADGGWQPWADEIAAAASYPRLYCKLSGLVTEADHASWIPADLDRYLDHLFDCFGPERLLWGSDWPVCLLAADYVTVHDVIASYVARHCPDHADAIFGGNAVAAYSIQLSS